MDQLVKNLLENYAAMTDRAHQAEARHLEVLRQNALLMARIANLESSLKTAEGRIKILEGENNGTTRQECCGGVPSTRQPAEGEGLGEKAPRDLANVVRIIIGPLPEGSVL